MRRDTRTVSLGASVGLALLALAVLRLGWSGAEISEPQMKALLDGLSSWHL